MDGVNITSVGMQRVQLRIETGNVAGRIVGSVGQNLGRKTRRRVDAGWPKQRGVDMYQGCPKISLAVGPLNPGLQKK